VSSLFGSGAERTGPNVALGPTHESAGTSPAIDPVELYAAGIDNSDYVARVGPLIRQGVRDIGDLLDIGAGGGQLGHALRVPNRRWTAIEPPSNMGARLARLSAPPRVIAEGWEAADLPVNGHDTVLAANIAAPLQEPNAFLARCLGWSRRSVIWVVPAQHGPHGLCFAGCLPAAWHGEDETPGVDLVLRSLAPSAQPHSVVVAEWTFGGIVADVAELATYLADRLGWPTSRCSEMTAHLARQAKPDPRGYRLEIPRKSAVLVWTCQEGGVRD
jgi:hypothetical protein